MIPYLIEKVKGDKKRNAVTKEIIKDKGGDGIIIDHCIMLQMAVWALQLISRWLQGTSIVSHYSSNWKPEAEASDYPGSNLREAVKTMA